MTKFFKIFILAACLLVAAIAGANLFLLQRHVQSVLADDSRNAGLSLWAHYEYFVIPTTLVIDLRQVSVTNSPADVTRVLLQFSKTQAQTKFELVKLAHQGSQKFLLKGDYFQTLGQEFGTQNPVYTMRTLPENVFHLDGSPAFGTWTGGMLGVLGKQMEDLSDFHKQWYILDLAKSK